jgi:protein ImuB
MIQEWVGIRYRDWLEAAYFKSAMHPQEHASTPLETPFAITGSKSPFKIVALNDQARSAGIQPLMNLASAEALAPHLITAILDPARESESILGRAQIWQSITPYVYPINPDIVLLNVTHCLQLWNGKHNLIQQMQDTLADTAYISRPSIAWGFSPLAVQAFLRHTANQALQQGICAEACLESIKTVHITALPEDSSKSNPLDSRILERIKTKLIRMGLQTLDDLFHIPKHELTAACPLEFIHYLEKLCGDRSDPQQEMVVPHQFKTGISIEDGANTEAQICHYFDQAVLNLQPELIKHQLATNCIIVTLTDESKKITELRIGTRQSSQQLKTVSQLFALQLSRLRISEPVMAIHIDIPKLTPATLEPDSLFPESTRKIYEAQKKRLFDRLQNRLGDTAIQELRPVAHHVPELSWSTLESNLPSPATQLSARRPYFLYDKPIAIGKTNQLLFYQTPLKIIYGPEIIDVLTWLQPETRRYYVATNLNNQRYWIYQTQHEAWYIHGLFA